MADELRVEFGPTEVGKSKIREAIWCRLLGGEHPAPAVDRRDLLVGNRAGYQGCESGSVLDESVDMTRPLKVVLLD